MRCTTLFQTPPNSERLTSSVTRLGCRHVALPGYWAAKSPFVPPPLGMAWARLEILAGPMSDPRLFSLFSISFGIPSIPFHPHHLQQTHRFALSDNR